ncbi:MAG: cysteine--tRNA ligase [Patescibacteria group bacterium]|nr:cysteine--tRNA ligase [Patescibacteria group bacterium]
MLKLYNTLSRKKEAFEPIGKGRGKTVKLYTCGPTTYGPAHIGNLRTYVFEDVLRRWLEHGHGWKVKQVMNITDIEDKILAASKAKTLDDVRAFTKPHEERFFADVDKLGIERAEAYPKATEHVGAMIKLIERIQAAGFAYERDGSVYFDVRKYHRKHHYGKLLKIDSKHFGGEKGSRIDADEYDKDSPRDFALWKREPKGTVGVVGWRSPWGHGRPGWHVECSAMAAALKLPLDIHAGAVDLTFPHHENEIAQTRAGDGQDLARFWLHAEHLLIDGAKMAKSDGNIVTLADVTQRGFEPVHLRTLFVQAHYRGKLNFTWQSLQAAKESYERLQTFYDRLSEQAGDAPEGGEAVTKLIADTQARFAAAMDDDLNTAEAVAAVFDFVRDGNALIDAGELGTDRQEDVLEALHGFNDVLGVLTLEVERAPKRVNALADDREAARRRDDFAEADRLRKQISKAGWTVEDTPRGPRLRKR